MNQKIFLLAILFLQCIFVIGQTSDVSELPNFIPPSPTAYELGKYGQVPVGMFTGTPNVNVPLYQYNTKNLTVPISLSYNSNGIKVDQLSSNVGLGWSLNIGGVISRITRDKSDEENALFFPEEEISEAGVRSPMALDFFYMAGMDDVDTETDLFMYNFNGYSGSFVFDNNKRIVQLPKKDIRIEHYGEGTAVGFRITTPDGVSYTFLDEEISLNRISGGGLNPPLDNPTTTAWYLTRIEHPKGDIINFVYVNNNYSYVGGKTQSFQVLSPLLQPTCSGMAAGGYNIFPTPTTTYNSNVNHVGKKLVEINSNFPSSGKIFVQSDLNHPGVPGHSLVTGISVKNQSSQTIENFGFEYIFTGNNRVFLQEIAYMDPDKKYNFDYLDPAGLTSRLSFSQDHWGYYNGKSNSYLFPNPQTLGPNISQQLTAHDMGADKSIDTLYAAKGLLKKIIYPTKGSNEFIYESNTYRGDVTIYDEHKYSLALTGDSEQFEMGYGNDDIKSLSVLYDQEVEVYLSAYFNSSVCPSGSNTGKSKATFSIQDLADNSFVTLFSRSAYGYFTSLGNSYTVGPDTNYKIYAYLKVGKNYTLKLHPTFECVTSGAMLWYKKEVPHTVTTNIKTGGLRIQQVKSYDPVSNKTNTDRYYYGKIGSKNISSAEKGQTPYYISNTTNRIQCDPGSFTDVTYLNLASNSMRSLYNSSGSNTTYYNYVTLSHGGNNFENGGEEHEFILDNDYPGRTLFGDHIESSPWTNFGWSNGLEKRSSIFKKNDDGSFVILNETINEYKEDPRLFDEVYGYSVRKKFHLPYPGEINYSCTSKDINKVYEEYYCAASHNHIWGSSALSSYGGAQMCTASGNDNKVRLRPHPCNSGNKQVGDIISYPDYLDNLDIQEYKSISYWHYLDSSTNIQYDEFGQNPVTVVTENYYDNPRHKQLTRQKSSGSKNNSIVTTFFYPGDVQGVSDLEYDDLTTSEYNAIDKLKEVRDDGQTGLYFIGTPVQTKKQVLNSSEITLSTTVERTNFKEINNIILPEFIQTTKANNPLENRIKYLRYDNNGNPQEIARQDGPSVVYIWGYDKLYPIAKIENATYADIALALSVSRATLDGYSEADSTAINGLRSSLPQAMVTTYTYQPLIGVTSITDPKGYTTSYEYDDFNRLEYVKNADGKILNKNEYHYKGQL